MEINTENISEEIVLVQKALENAQTYNEYRDLVANLTAEGSNTGAQQTEALAQYTQLNNSRMRRLDKTTKIDEVIETDFKNFTGNQTWVVLTESWCGDAAQSMPAMNKLAELSPNIDFKVVLRDQNEALMDAFLTNGGRSIPKLIVIDNDTQKIKSSWGPRPSVATKMVQEYKNEHGTLTPEFKQELQVWYNKDKSQNVISDLAKLL